MQPLWRTGWRFPRKLKTELQYDSPIPLLSRYSDNSCPTLCNPMGCHQASLSMGFSRQEYGSGWPFPPPGDLPNPGMEPTSSASPALEGGFFTTALPGKPHPDNTTIQEDSRTPMFIAAIFTIAKTWKHPKSSWTDE